ADRLLLGDHVRAVVALEVGRDDAEAKVAHVAAQEQRTLAGEGFDADVVVELDLLVVEERDATEDPDAARDLEGEAGVRGAVAIRVALAQSVLEDVTGAAVKGLFETEDVVVELHELGSDGFGALVVLGALERP